MQIRWMTRHRDLPDVLEIEQLCYPFPWSEEQFVSVLRRTDCCGIVVEHNESVCGFAVYQLGDALEILNIAVHPSCWRRGVGSLLVDTLRRKLCRKRPVLATQVCESNVVAQLFLRSHGLRHACTIRQPYDEVDWDGYLMVYELGADVRAVIAE